MKRKILIALLLLLVIGTGAGIGTWANYFKSIQSENNSVQASKFEFNVDKLDDSNTVTPWQNIVISGDVLKPGSNDSITLADYQLDFDVKVPTKIDLVFDANSSVADFFKQTVQNGGSSEDYYNNVVFDIAFSKKNLSGDYVQTSTQTLTGRGLLEAVDKKSSLTMFDGTTADIESYRCEVSLRWIDNNTLVSLDSRTKVSVDTLFQNKQGTFDLRFEAIQK